MKAQTVAAGTWVDVPSIYCSCGAQWHGKHALRDQNPVIEDHAHRRFDYRCRFISQGEFEARFPRKRGRTPGRKSFGAKP